MSYFVPTEYFLPLALVGAVSLLLRFRGFAKACFLLAFLILAYRPAKEFLGLFLPGWLAVLIGLVILLVAIRVALAFVFGKAAIDNLIGQLLANGITAMFRVFGRIVSPIWIAFRSGGILHKGIQLTYNSFSKPDGKPLHDDPKRKQEIDRFPDLTDLEGTIVSIGPKECLVELDDGLVGVFTSPEDRTGLSIGDEVKCRVIKLLSGNFAEIALVPANKGKTGINPDPSGEHLMGE